MVALKSPDGRGTQVSFAPDLKGAQTLFKQVQCISEGVDEVGVITDLMFPRETGGKEELNGLSIVAECIDAKVPVVVCSDTDHHELGWLRPIFPLLERAHPAGKIPIILDKKDWGQAVALLAEVTKVT